MDRPLPCPKPPAKPHGLVLLQTTAIYPKPSHAVLRTSHYAIDEHRPFVITSRFL